MRILIIMLISAFSQLCASAVETEFVWMKGGYRTHGRPNTELTISGNGEYLITNLHGFKNFDINSGSIIGTGDLYSTMCYHPGEDNYVLTNHYYNGEYELPYPDTLIFLNLKTQSIDERIILEHNDLHFNDYEYIIKYDRQSNYLILYGRWENNDTTFITIWDYEKKKPIYQEAASLGSVAYDKENKIIYYTLSFLLHSTKIYYYDIINRKEGKVELGAHNYSPENLQLSKDYIVYRCAASDTLKILNRNNYLETGQVYSNNRKKNSFIISSDTLFYLHNYMLHKCDLKQPNKKYMLNKSTVNAAYDNIQECKYGLIAYSTVDGRIDLLDRGSGEVINTLAFTPFKKPFEFYGDSMFFNGNGIYHMNGKLEVIEHGLLDGNMLYNIKGYTSKYGTLMMYNIETKKMDSLIIKKYILGYDVDNGHLLLKTHDTETQSDSLIIYDIEKRESHKSIQMNTSDGFKTFIKDNKVFISYRNNFKVWDFKKDTLFKLTGADYLGKISNNKDYVFCNEYAVGKGFTSYLDTRTLEFHSIPRIDEDISDVTVSKDNKHMFIVPDDKFENFVYYYDIENKTMKKVCRIEEHVNFDYDENYTFYVDRHIQRRAYLSPNNEYLITNSDENCTILWKIDGLTSVNEIIEKKSPKNIIVEGDIIELESYCDYSVYDLTGKLLKSGNGFQIDTHNLYPGMYFVLLKKGNKEINRFSFIIY